MDMINQFEWIFVSLFPNLLIKRPIQTNYASIVSYSDDRVKLLSDKYPSIYEIFNSFVDTRLNSIEPAVLLIHKKAYSNEFERRNAVVAFRNIVALSVILREWIPLVHSKEYSISNILFSEYFDLFPINGYDKNSYFIESPASYTFVKDAKISFQSNYLLPTPYNDLVIIDTDLFDALINIWEDYFINGNKIHSYSALFRSFQLAFSASRMPTDNYSTLYDYGTKVSLWVSAFEILFHPGNGGRIGIKNIVNEINKFELFSPEIKNNDYIVKDIPTNIVGWIYNEIYESRNDFSHGNVIDENGLYLFRQSNLPTITRIAPVIYLIALQVFLNNNNLLRKAEPKTTDARMVKYLLQKTIEEVFIEIVT